MNSSPFHADLFELLSRNEFDELISRCDKLLKLLWTSAPLPHPHSPGIVWWRALGDFCGAAIDYERSVAMHHGLGNVPSDFAVACQDLLGRTLLWSGRAAEAEEKFAEALVWLDHLPETQQQGRGFVLIDLAQLHCWAGELETAERLLIEARECMQRYYGRVSRRMGYVSYHFASVYGRQGKIPQEDAAMEESIRLLRSTVKEDDDGLASVISCNGLRLKRRGRFEESRKCQVEALAMLERIRKPGHYLLERVRHRLVTAESAA